LRAREQCPDQLPVIEENIEMAQPAVPLPEKMERIKVLAAESTRMNS